MTCHAAIDDCIKQHWGSVLSVLIAWLKDIELAEDVLQESCLAALQCWPRQGVPDNPRAWLLRSARNQAIDTLRRQRNYAGKLQQIQALSRLQSGYLDQSDTSEIPDQLLKLIFTCAHPALKPSAQVALTLHTVAGLKTEQIASAYLVSTSTMAQRLVRAKRKISKAGIPYAVPDSKQLPERLESVLAIIYLIFNQGYQASHSQDLMMPSLMAEALNLCATVTRLLPDQPEALGLLALMMFHDARTASRSSHDGALQTLEMQDRSRWDQIKIRKADRLLQQALNCRQPGSYQIQAAISAVHCHSGSFAATDWPQIERLYARLFDYEPSAVVRLNWICARAEVFGAEAALVELQQLFVEHQQLLTYPACLALQAELLQRTGADAAAAEALKAAARYSSNQAEQAFFDTRRQHMLNRTQPHGD